MAQNTMGFRDAYTQTLDIDIYPKGLDGKDGVSIAKMEINSQNHVITTMSDGTVIDGGEITMKAGNFAIKVVSALPTEDISVSTIYCLATSDPTTDNKYDEYAYVNSAWERIGSATIDLSNYYTKSEVDGIKTTIEGEISDTKEDLQKAIDNHTNAETITSLTAESNDTYYLLGTESEQGALQTEVVNSGIKYVKGTTEEKGNLYIEDEQVVTSLYFDIS